MSDTAIEALRYSEFPNSSDTISRQAAISICDNAIDLWNGQLGTGALVAVRDAIMALPSAQPNLDEWCTDCKEYDHEKHCCPRFNRVIRDTLNEVEPMRKRGTWMHDKDDVLISGYCSCCGWESIIMETDVADMPFCPNCGADMRGEES